MFENFVEARGGENEIGGLGRIAPIEFGAATTGDNGESGIVGERESSGELLLGCGLGDEFGGEAVEGVGSGSGTEILRAEDGGELLFDGSGCGHVVR